jgi:hypothetical protein
MNETATDVDCGVCRYGQGCPYLAMLGYPNPGGLEFILCIIETANKAETWD